MKLFAKGETSTIPEGYELTPMASLGKLMLEQCPELPEPDEILGSSEGQYQKIITKDELPSVEELMQNPVIREVVQASYLLHP